MGQKEKITEHFNGLREKAHTNLALEVPEGVPKETFGILMDYADAILEKKAGEKNVDLKAIESRLNEEVGNNVGNVLLKSAKDCVNRAIKDIFGTSFYGKG